MARVQFTPHLQQFVDCPSSEVSGNSVRTVLEAVFAQNPRLRGYVLDDQSCLRRHVVIFLNGEPVQDREKLSDAVQESSELFVMQALSGG